MIRYRNTIRCKICHNVFENSLKHQHLKEWRSLQVIQHLIKKFLSAVNSSNIAEIELCLDHGLKLSSKLSDNGDSNFT